MRGGAGKWLVAKEAAAAVKPSSVEEQEGGEEEGGEESVAATLSCVNEGFDAALSDWDPSGSVEDLRGAVLDNVKVVATEKRKAELEASGAELAVEAGELRLTVAVLCGEDVPMGVVNIWLMTTFASEISALLLVSFALNCVLLGFKLPKVLELAKIGARRVKEAAAAASLKRVKSKARKSIAERRASIAEIASEEKEEGSGAEGAEVEQDTDVVIAALRAEVAALSAAKDAELAAKDAELAANHLEVAAKDAEIAANHLELAAKERRIVELGGGALT